MLKRVGCDLFNSIQCKLQSAQSTRKAMLYPISHAHRHEVLYTPTLQTQIQRIHHMSGENNLWHAVLLDAGSVSDWDSSLDVDALAAFIR